MLYQWICIHFFPYESFTQHGLCASHRNSVPIWIDNNICDAYQDFRIEISLAHLVCTSSIYWLNAQFQEEWDTLGVVPPPRMWGHPRAIQKGLSFAHPCFLAVVPNRESPDILGLKFPEILAGTAGGEGFWEFESKNIWGPKVGTTALYLHPWDTVGKWKTENTTTPTSHNPKPN